jgi:hypothetical protein
MPSAPARLPAIGIAASGVPVGHNVMNWNKSCAPFAGEPSPFREEDFVTADFAADFEPHTKTGQASEGNLAQRCKHH